MYTRNYKGHTIEIGREKEPVSPLHITDKSAFLTMDYQNHGQSIEIPPPENIPRSAIFGELYKSHHLFSFVVSHTGHGYTLQPTSYVENRSQDEHLENGLILVDRKLCATYVDARNEAIAIAKMWENYLNGNIWGYVVKNRAGKQVAQGSGYHEKTMICADMLCMADAEHDIDKLTAIIERKVPVNSL